MFNFKNELFTQAWGSKNFFTFQALFDFPGNFCLHRLKAKKLKFSIEIFKIIEHKDFQM